MASSWPTPTNHYVHHYLSSEEMLGHLTRSGSGEHNILVYRNLESFRTLYPQYCKRLLDDNDVVIFLSYYEEIEALKSHLVNVGIDVANELSKGNLIIADAVKEFFGAGKDILMFFLNLERQIKALGKNNLSVIVCMGVFHHFENKIDEMLEYESLLALSNVRNWKVLCCYDEQDLGRLTDEMNEELMGKHCRKIIWAKGTEKQGI